MKGILKGPLIVGAVVVILRIITERLGMPAFVSSALSVVALHMVLGPLYFSIRIGLSSVPNPYLVQIKLVALYVLALRAMIVPVYWLGRIFKWPESRFGGLFGSPFSGFVVVPFATAAIWIVSSLICGTILGAIVITIVRWLVKTPSSADTARKV